MTTQTMLTLEEFLALPESEEDGSHYELSEGELITLSPASHSLGAFVANVTTLLKNTLDRKRYIVASGDVGLILQSKSRSATVRGADVVVHERKKVGSIKSTVFQRVAPLVTVEVISPKNETADIALRVKQYLKAGAGEVWILYPATRTLHVFGQGAHEAKIFEEHETFPSILGREFAVAPFFEL